MNIQDMLGAEHSEYIVALARKNKSNNSVGNFTGSPAQRDADTVSISPEARAAQQASVDNCQNLQDDLAGKAKEVLFSTVHSDVSEFRKENPDASEREVWNYIAEKYNLPCSTGMMTLEEAQANLQPYLSTDPRTLTGWHPSVKISTIDLEEWERAFLKV